MDLPASPDRVALANQVFSDALDLPATERGSFVRQQCQTDPELCESVLQLLSQYDRLGDFLEAPPFQSGARLPLEFQPGEVLGKRFRIVRQLGRGGIGEVYRADDLELREPVALKTLRPALRDNPSVAARFREELRLARKIGHPNVCRIFDLFSDVRDGVEIWYFSMEYLEGTTLAQRLAAGPLDPATALDFARQIAAGLDAAHATGIIHRDLKPANIMLVAREGGGERAAITDFGLAKLLDTAEARWGETQAGQVLGTPEYMAPEQILGAEVTPATDIYALGLIVFEMTTGRRPFPQESAIRAAVRRVVDQPPSLRPLAPAAPARWDAAIRSALANSPGRRPSSAREMIDMMESGQTPTTVIRRLSKVSVSRRTVLYAGGVSLMAVSYAAFRYWDRRPLIGSGDSAPLLMLTPLVQAGPTNGDIQGSTLGLMIARTLQQSSRVRVLAPEKVEAGWGLVRSKRDEPLPSPLPASTARHIALSEGASLVLFGSVSQVGDEWTLALRLELVQGSPDQARAGRNETFHDANAATAALQASNWIRRTVSESEMQVRQRNRRPEELTTRNWHSLEQFVESQQAWQQGNRQAALEHLREALDGDPEFAMAAARLGDLLTGMGRPDQGLPYHQQAEKILVERGLTDRESLQIRGMFALDTGRFAEAEHVYSLFSEEFPSDNIPLLHRATALDRMGRPEEAEKVLDIAIAREPKSYELLFRRSHLLLDLGRLDEAARDADAAAALIPNDFTDQLRSAIAYGRLAFPKAAEYVDRMREAGSNSFKSKVHSFRACFLADQGNMSAAEKLLEDGIAFDLGAGFSAESQLRKRCQLAQLLMQSGRLEEARAQCRAALKTSPGIETTLQIAGVLARAGDLKAAEACVPQIEPKWPIQSHWLALLRGELALARGDARQAVALMSERSAARTSGEFPSYLLRAARAAGDAAAVSDCLMSLFTNPGRYWYQANVSEPGFVRLALTAAEAGRFSPTQPGAANNYRALANFFLRR